MQQAVALPGDVWILADNPGGAEILAAFALKNNQNHRLHFTLTGAAIEIFKRRLPAAVNEPLHGLARLSPDDAMLICGTDFDSTRVSEAIDYGRKLGFRTVGLLDHWVNYRQRFGDVANWPDNLPDQIWVLDEYAQDLALEEGFPEDRIRLYPNPYFDLLREMVEERREPKSQSTRGNLLYLSEPIISDDSARKRGEAAWGYTEYSLLQGLLTVLPELEGQVAGLRIRLHPREQSDKYETLLRQHQATVPIEISANFELADDLAWADVVLGSHSMGLVAATEVGLPAVSCVPPDGRPCLLPHREITKVHDYRDLASAFDQSAKVGLSGPRIDGQHVYLRPPTYEDAAEGPWHSWFNDPDATRYTRHGGTLNTREDQIRFFQALHGDESRLVLAVCDRQTGEHVGVVSLQSIDRERKRAEIAIMIGSAAHRRGFSGLEAWALITQYGFDNMDLSTIYAGSHEGLESWVKLVEILGFRETHREPRTMKTRGESAVVIRYECSAGDFQTLRDTRGPLSVLGWARSARRESQ